MKTLPLRTLLREPNKVKKMTRGGMVVRITDRGEPLWDLKAVAGEKRDEKSDKEIDKLLNEVLKTKPSRISASQLLIDSRR